MSLKNRRIYSGADPEQVAADLGHLVSFSDEGMTAAELKNLVEERLTPHLLNYDLPQFQSMFNGFPGKGAKLGAQIALVYNQGVTNWQVSPGGAMLEELCCRELCRLFQLGPDADATFMYSGTYANQQAVYMALHRFAERAGFDLNSAGLSGFKDPSRLAIVTSRDCHFSVKHAARILGLGEQAVIPVETDSNHRINFPELSDLLEKQKVNRDIFCVIATAGTTSTGAVDPLAAIADLCKSQGIWLHIDGAYGLAYSLVPEWAHLFTGMERADSISWDPHKQMGVPIPCSLLFSRDWKDFGRMAVNTTYFNRDQDSEPNPGLKSPPSTRPMSALPLITALRLTGIKGLRKRLSSPLRAIRELYDYCQQLSDIKVCHKPDTGILCFQVIPKEFPAEKLNALQETIFRTIQQQGERSISITSLKGKIVLRLLAISTAVDKAALIETVSIIRQTAKTINPRTL